MTAENTHQERFDVSNKAAQTAQLSASDPEISTELSSRPKLIVPTNIQTYDVGIEQIHDLKKTPNSGDQLDEFTPEPGELKRYRDALDSFEQRVSKSSAASDAIKAGSDAASPEAPLFNSKPKTEDNNLEKKSAGKYSPNDYDLKLFEKNSGVDQRDFSRADLTSMSKLSDVGVQNLSKYLLENFDTVADLTSGGAPDTLGINDIRLLVTASDAARLAKSLEKPVSSAFDSFGKLDLDSDGLLSKKELGLNAGTSALKEQFDFIQSVDKSSTSDKGISRSTLENFKLGVTLDSIIHDAHYNEEANNRERDLHDIGALAANSVLTDLGFNYLLSTGVRKNISSVAGDITGFALQWFQSDNSEKHYSTTAKPALAKVLNTL